MADEQLELGFPDPEDFESYDDKDAAEVQASLPSDSFELNTADFETEGCDCVR
jgi:hypothetical protein